jgi:hypothetical protein
MLELLVLLGLSSLLAFLCFCVLCKGVSAILVLMWEILKTIGIVIVKGCGLILRGAGRFFLFFGALLGLAAFNRSHRTRKDSDEDYVAMRGLFIHKNRLTRRVEALEEILSHR